MGMQRLCCASAIFSRVRAASLWSQGPMAELAELIHALAGEVQGRVTAAMVVASNLGRIRTVIQLEMG